MLKIGEGEKSFANNYTCIISLNYSFISLNEIFIGTNPPQTIKTAATIVSQDLQ